MVGLGTGTEPKTEIGLIALDDGISVRRMVVHAIAPKGTVILLHGFPETLYAWRDRGGDTGNLETER